MMVTHPLFTQKHYEHLIEQIRKQDFVHDDAREIFIGVLCDIFKEDNPSFKSERFEKLCNIKEEVK
ncbi:MAG: hypothetical protein L0287_24735 [Anaerolineae bacterium]|nr:hypothetical protein [Anaerolineae bacterium]